MTATLYSIHHSPWSERARWAIEHHALPFEEKVHVPLVGELGLRLRAKKWGKVSVPLFVDEDGTVVQGSLAIAEHVDVKGKHASLFPNAEREKIRALFETLEDALNAARARHVTQLATDVEGQYAALPPFLRRLPFAPASARLGARFIAKKYDAKNESTDERMRSGLRTVRDALGGRLYVLDAFSFADVLGASIIQTIEPPAHEYLQLPEATRRLWTHDALRTEFADLVQWRDELYRKHRAAERIESMSTK